jgi:hypothetical protein
VTFDLVDASRMDGRSQERVTIDLPSQLQEKATLLEDPNGAHDPETSDPRLFQP